MAIAHDQKTRFPTTAGATDVTTGDRTFTHTPIGTPKGVVITLCCTGTAAPVTGILYGGIAMTRTAAVTDITEAGRVEIYTLTRAVIPTGVQTVTLQNCIAATKYCSCSTVTAATDGTLVDAFAIVDTVVSANPIVNVVTTQATCGYSGFHSGAAAPVAAGTGNTLHDSADYGALMSQTHRRTANAEAAGTIAHQTAALASDDWCGAAVNLAEYTLPLPTPDVTFPRRRT